MLCQLGFFKFYFYYYFFKWCAQFFNSILCIICQTTLISYFLGCVNILLVLALRKQCFCPLWMPNIEKMNIQHTYYLKIKILLHFFSMISFITKLYLIRHLKMKCSLKFGSNFIISIIFLPNKLDSVDQMCSLKSSD